MIVVIKGESDIKAPSVSRHEPGSVLAPKKESFPPFLAMIICGTGSLSAGWLKVFMANDSTNLVLLKWAL